MSFDRLATIAGKLETVRSQMLPAVLENIRNRTFSHVFGAEAHKFRLEEPVPETVVAAFEVKHKISLPPEYRAFITTVGSGGAGPGFGLVPFDKAVTYERWVPDDIVARSFPLLEAYNHEEDPAFDGLEGEEYNKRVEALVGGTLVMCHEGCGYYHLLVVNGNSYGQMWIDCTVSGAGYIPLDVGFLDWYERWLDDILSGEQGAWWFRKS